MTIWTSRVVFTFLTSVQYTFNTVFFLSSELGTMAKRKRTGGIQQRIAQANAEVRVETCGNESQLAQFLLERFAWGEMSPQLLQRISHLAVQDFLAAEKNEKVLGDLRALASIGTNGTYPNKCHADLMAKAEKISCLPDPFRISMPFAPPVGEFMQGILLPHEMFSAMYHQYPNTFKKSVLNSEDALKSFWNSVAQHPQMHAHPLKDIQHYKTTCIPIALHGDGVPIVGLGKGWSRVMTLFSWYSLVGQGHTRELLFWVWGIYDRLIKGAVDGGTRAKFFAVLCWSFRVMLEGRWPSHDFEGKRQHLNPWGKIMTWNYFWFLCLFKNGFCYSPMWLKQECMLAHVILWEKTMIGNRTDCL